MSDETRASQEPESDQDVSVEELDAVSGGVILPMPRLSSVPASPSPTDPATKGKGDGDPGPVSPHPPKPGPGPIP